MASASIRECSLHKVSGSHIIVSFAQKKYIMLCVDMEITIVSCMRISESTQYKTQITCELRITGSLVEPLIVCNKNYL